MNCHGSVSKIWFIPSVLWHWCCKVLINCFPFKLLSDIVVRKNTYFDIFDITFDKISLQCNFTVKLHGILLVNSCIFCDFYLFLLLGRTQLKALIAEVGVILKPISSESTKLILTDFESIRKLKIFGRRFFLRLKFFISEKWQFSKFFHF